MNSLSAVAISCILLPSILICAPTDPPTVESVIRLRPGQQYGLLPYNVNISLGPFALDPGQPSIGIESLARNSAVVSSQTTTRYQDQDDLNGESSSYVKPALFVGGALAVTGILIWTDQTTYDILHRWRTFSDPIEDVSPVITNLGDGRASMAIFGGFLAYSYLGNDRSAFQAAKIGIESFLVSGIATQILKHTFGRQRPSTATVNGGRWNGVFLFLNQGSGKRGSYAGFDSFPSGHTSTIFAAATTLAEVYHDSPWVSYASYTVASSVAISRVMEQTHWLSDCFVGGLIGYYSTQLVLHYNHSDKPVVLLPMYNGQSVGLALNASF